MLVSKIQSVGRNLKPIAKQSLKSNQQASNAIKRLQQISLGAGLSVFAISKSTNANDVKFGDGGPSICDDGIPYSTMHPDLYSC